MIQKSPQRSSCLWKVTNVMSSINFLFKAKGSSIPLWLRKLILKAAGENKLNYVVAILFINFELLKLPREPQFLNGPSHTEEQSKLYQCWQVYIPDILSTWHSYTTAAQS